MNARTSEALTTFAAADPDLDRERLVFAVVDVPYGAVRRHLVRRTPPPLVDELIVATCRAVLPSTARRE